MSKPKVLVADPVSERGVAELQEGDLLEVVVKTGLKEDQLLEIREFTRDCLVNKFHGTSHR